AHDRRGRALPCPSSPRAKGLGRLDLGLLREQSKGTLLSPDRCRPQTARPRDIELGAVRPPRLTDPQACVRRPMSNDAHVHLRRVLRPLMRPRVEADEEIAFHIDMRTAELIARGVAPDEARRKAVAYFGDVDRVRDELDAFNSREKRRMSIREWTDGLRHDLSYAA